MALTIPLHPQLRARVPLLEFINSQKSTKSFDVQRLCEHLEKVLVELEFLDPANPRLLMRRLMRLFNRVELTTNEVNNLRGILTSVTQFRHRTKS